MAFEPTFRCTGFCHWLVRSLDACSRTNSDCRCRGFLLKRHKPIAVAWVWLTNPVTWIPLFYFAYRLGLWSLNRPEPNENFEFTMEAIIAGMDTIGIPLLFGCLLLGISCAIFGYYFIKILWRWNITSKWKKRKRNRMANSSLQ